jgi:hypothetical protein
MSIHYKRSLITIVRYEDLVAWGSRLLWLACPTIGLESSRGTETCEVCNIAVTVPTYRSASGTRRPGAEPSPGASEMLRTMRHCGVQECAEDPQIEYNQMPGAVDPVTYNTQTESAPLRSGNKDRTPGRELAAQTDDLGPPSFCIGSRVVCVV